MTVLCGLDEISKLKVAKVSSTIATTASGTSIGLAALTALAVLSRAVAAERETGAEWLGLRETPGSDKEPEESQDNLHVDSCQLRIIEDELNNKRAAIRIYRYLGREFDPDPAGLPGFPVFPGRRVFRVSA